MMDEDMTRTGGITDVSETMLVPLYARAIESESKDPLLVDAKAVEIVKELNERFRSSDSTLHRSLFKSLARGRLRKRLHVTLALRTRRFDQYCLEFLGRNPAGLIVELGCGLSTRFVRIDNQRLTWYGVDFPAVIAVRKQFFRETPRYHDIGASVLDFRWMHHVQPQESAVLFLAEGLLMYLHESEARDLVLKLEETFPGSELVCEVVSSSLVHALEKRIWRRKFQRDFHLGSAIFMFGVSDSREFEKWDKGIRFLDDWTYFDEKERKLGWMNFFGRFERMRKTQWIVHYRLD